MILGIDTSAAQCAVALVGAGDPLIERRTMERGHAEHLFPMIEEIFARAGAGWTDLSRIGVCTGPGSFTGLRIGIAAARGIALGRGIPVIGINRFEALAAEAGGRVAVCLSGRGSTVFLQCFEASGAAVTEPEVTSEAMLNGAIPADTIRLAGDAAGAGALVAHGLPDPMLVARLASEREPGPLPAPLYLRGADAALPRDGPPTILD